MKQKSHQCPSSQFHHGEKREIFEEKEIAETFNNFFINSDAKSCLHSWKQSVIPKLDSIPQSLPQYHQSYDLELENAFSTLKLNKNPECDDISPDVDKIVSNEIFFILKHIFNIALGKGVFPEKQKIAWVTPIFKAGNNTLVTNYRLISVLPCFSKLLERIMCNHLYTFLVEKNILYQKQSGFQNAHSTEHSII